MSAMRFKLGAPVGAVPMGSRPPPPLALKHGLFTSTARFGSGGSALWYKTAAPKQSDAATTGI